MPSSSYLYVDPIHGRVAYVDDGVSTLIANRFPRVRDKLEEHISAHGNEVFLMSAKGSSSWRSRPELSHDDAEYLPYHLINFPVKPGVVYIEEEGLSSLQPQYRECAPVRGRLPGYMAKARLGIVEESVKELLDLIGRTKWRRVVVPEFVEPEVNAFLEEVLDGRFLLAPWRPSGA